VSIILKISYHYILSDEIVYDIVANMLINFFDVIANMLINFIDSRTVKLILMIIIITIIIF